MNSDGTHNSTSNRTQLSIQQLPTGGLVIVSGVLVGFGALVLVRGLHLYLHFYNYASAGMATGRLFQTLLWSVTGGIVLSLGIFLLMTTTAQDT